MRSTVRIDDDLMEALKARAKHDGTSLTCALNSTLRLGLEAANEKRSRERFKQRTISFGKVRFDIDKALNAAAAIEDEQTLGKLSARK